MQGTSLLCRSWQLNRMQPVGADSLAAASSKCIMAVLTRMLTLPDSMQYLFIKSPCLFSSAVH